MATQVVSPPAEGVSVHRFSADDYHKMGEVGILGPELRTELLDGVIYDLSPPGPLHSDNTDELVERWILALRGRARVRGQNPLALAQDGEPQPDIVLLRRRRYRDRNPVPADVLLIMEVTDATVAHDLQLKALRYAQAGIPEYWVYLVRTPELAVHREPSAEGYKSITRHGPGQPVSPLAFPDVSFDLAELAD